MNDDEWLALIRAAMPALTATTYLNTGSYGPLSLPVFEAMAARERRDLELGRAGLPETPEHEQIASLLRGDVAELLGCAPTEIALTRGTSDGVNYALWGIDWRAGDELVVSNLEHIGGVGAAYVLRDRFGIRLRFADCSRNERAVDAIRAELSERTRAVAVSHVAYGTGQVLPVAAIASAAHEAGALAIVDGAQSAGATPVDVKALRVDAYAIPGQKWLCGPGGTGALYVSAGTLDHFKPSFAAYGTFSVFDEQGEGVYYPDARRLELGFGHTPSLVGMRAALRWLLDEVGLEWALSRTAALADYARKQLATVPGVTVGTPIGTPSGITTFSIAGHGPDAVVADLFARKIIVRSVPRPAALRASTGFFNTEEDIDQLVSAVREIA